MSKTPTDLDMVRPLPRSMRLLGAGLTGCLAVLFVVVLLQTRQQGQRLQDLQDPLLRQDPLVRGSMWFRLPCSYLS